MLRLLRRALPPPLPPQQQQQQQGCSDAAICEAVAAPSSLGRADDAAATANNTNGTSPTTSNRCAGDVAAFAVVDSAMAGGKVGPGVAVSLEASAVVAAEQVSPPFPPPPPPSPTATSFAAADAASAAERTAQREERQQQCGGLPREARRGTARQQQQQQARSPAIGPQQQRQQQQQQQQQQRLPAYLVVLRDTLDARVFAEFRRPSRSGSLTSRVLTRNRVAVSAIDIVVRALRLCSPGLSRLGSSSDGSSSGSSSGGGIGSIGSGRGGGGIIIGSATPPQNLQTPPPTPNPYAGQPGGSTATISGVHSNDAGAATSSNGGGGANARAGATAAQVAGACPPLSAANPAGGILQTADPGQPAPPPSPVAGATASLGLHVADLYQEVMRVLANVWDCLDVTEAVVIRPLTRYLAMDAHPATQREAAAVLERLAATALITRTRATPLLVRLLKGSSDAGCRLLALRALAAFASAHAFKLQHAAAMIEDLVGLSLQSDSLEGSARAARKAEELRCDLADPFTSAGFASELLRSGAVAALLRGLRDGSLRGGEAHAARLVAFVVMTERRGDAELGLRSAFISGGGVDAGADGSGGGADGTRQRSSARAHAGRQSLAGTAAAGPVHTAPAALAPPAECGTAAAGGNSSAAGEGSTSGGGGSGGSSGQAGGSGGGGGGGSSDATLLHLLSALQGIDAEAGRKEDLHQVLHVMAHVASIPAARAALARAGATPILRSLVGMPSLEGELREGAARILAALSPSPPPSPTAEGGGNSSSDGVGGVGDRGAASGRNDVGDCGGGGTGSSSSGGAD